VTSDCPPPLVAMETVVLPTDDGSLFVVSTADTDTRAVTAAYDFWQSATEVRVQGDVDMTNKTTGRMTIMYRWSRVIPRDRRPVLDPASPICYDFEASRLVVQVEQVLDAGAAGTLDLDWWAGLRPSGDINADGKVDGADRGLLFADWSTSAQRSDLDANGVVDGDDLGILLQQWTPAQP
jgi:hypothetical protein